MDNLPKAINCRLSTEDHDLKEMLQKSEDKTARVKELLRKGLQYEASGLTEGDKQLKALEEKRARARQLAYRVSVRHERLPSPTLFTKTPREYQR